MQSNVQYFNTIPKKPFNWKRIILYTTSVVILYFVLFQPHFVGEIFGSWLNELVTGFKNKF